MKLNSPQTEQQLLICALETRSPRIRAMILSDTSIDDYGSKQGKEVRKRMDVLLERGKSLGRADDFAEDPAIAASEATVNFIRSTPARRKAARKFGREKVQQLIDQLKLYRNTRYVHEMQKEINQIAIGRIDEAGLNDIEMAMEETLSRIRSDVGVQPMTHFGKRQTAQEARREFEEVMTFNAANFVSTGFVGLDACIKGYERGNLVTISAPRGGGKTSFAMVGGLNQYMKSCHNVCFVSLEMTKKEMKRRIYSSLSGVEHDTVRYTKNITKEDFKQVEAAAQRFYKHGKSYDCDFTIWAPGDPMFTPMKMGSQVAPIQYDVLIIDYITLFNQGRHKDTWTMQMEYSRYLKMLAQKLNCVVVLLTQLSEEERVKYGRCLAHGSRVWGSGQQIQNVVVGDTTRTYAEDQQSITDTRAKRVFCNGEKSVLKICTKSREIQVTPNHHVLTKSPEGELIWKRASELRLHRKSSGSINYQKTDKLVICTDAGDGRATRLRDIVSMKRLRYSKYGNKGTPHHLDLPEMIEPWMCRLYGFLLGYGWIIDQPTNKSICFAMGVYEEVNERYEKLLTKLGLNPKRHLRKDGSKGWSIHAPTIQGVRLLQELGWKNGDKEKSVPPWVFRLPREHREEFVWGFMDADGWKSKPKTWKKTAYHFEIVNREMAHDIKALLDGLGYKCGRIRTRTRKPGRKIRGISIDVETTTYTLTFSKERFTKPYAHETVINLEEMRGKVQVYDIEVDHADHNYVADGVVVHNSIEENTDYWIWWRWREEEEQETGNVELRLAKARHARGGRKIPAKFRLDVMSIETTPPPQGQAGQKKASGEMSPEDKAWRNSEENE